MACSGWQWLSVDERMEPYLEELYGCIDCRVLRIFTLNKKSIINTNYWPCFGLHSWSFPDLLSRRYFYSNSEDETQITVPHDLSVGSTVRKRYQPSEHQQWEGECSPGSVRRLTLALGVVQCAPNLERKVSSFSGGADNNINTPFSDATPEKPSKCMMTE